MRSGTFGILGCGNMAEAILANAVKEGLLSPKAIIGHDRLAEKQVAFQKKFGIAVVESAQELVKQSHTLLIAVKPQDVKPLLTTLRPSFTKARKVVISIVAGLSIAHMEQWLGPDIPIFRAMPNTPIRVGEGVTLYAANSSAETEDLYFVHKLFAAGGGFCSEVESERHFDAITALSGSGPAYLFFFVEALEEAARALQLPEPLIQPMIQGTIHGALTLLKETKDTPRALREKVTSKGGTTEAALTVFDEMKVKEAIQRAVQAAAARSLELGKTLFS